MRSRSRPAECAPRRTAPASGGPGPGSAVRQERALLRTREPGLRDSAGRRRSCEAASGRSELLAGLLDPLRHRCLSGAAPCSRVVAALVSDPAADPEHTFPVVKHVTGERPGERVLVVGVDVYLHHPKRDRICELLSARPAAAVEHVLEAGAGVRGGERLLAGSQDVGTRTTLPGA